MLIDTYDYTDETGNVLYKIERHEPGKNGKKKDFLQLRILPDGTSEYGLTKETRRVLYRLPHVLAAKEVAILAGEKDVATAVKLGFDGATTNSGGEGHPWQEEWTECLRGKHCLIFADQDEPGQRRKQEIVDALSGHVASLAVIDVPVGKDLTEYFELGGTNEELNKLIELAKLPSNAPVKALKELVRRRGEPVALESEKLLLGAVLNGHCPLEEVACLVNSSDFSSDANRRIFQTICELDSTGSATDIKAVIQALQSKDQIESVGGVTYLLDLTEDLPGVYNIDQHIELVLKKAQTRAFVAGVTKAAEGLVVGGDLEDAREAVSRLVDSSVVYTSKDSPTYGVAEIMGSLDKFFDKKTPGIMCRPLGRLNELTYGLHPGQLMLIGGRPSSGKALDSNEPVMTKSDGWVRIADLKVGQELASHDGRPSFVTGVFPQGDKEGFQVSFDDGRKVIACGDHLWSAKYREWESPRILKTSKIAEMLTRKRYKRRLQCPILSRESSFGDGSVRNPWLIGYFLGNGGLTGRTAVVTIPDQETLDRVRKELSEDFDSDIRLNSKISYRITRKTRSNDRSDFTEFLESLGMMGKGCYFKKIPERYKTASAEDRREMLRGLMDSDGYVNEFSSSSMELAYDVADLVRSLGGISSVSSRIPTFTYLGEKKQGHLNFRVHVSRLKPEDRFWLKRKIEACGGEKKRYLVSNFDSIVPAGIRDMTCISVSHPDGLFVTRDYIVTHNTSLMNLLCAYAAIQGHRTDIISLEVSKEECLLKIVCTVAKVSFQDVQAGRITAQERIRLAKVSGELASSPLRIDDRADWNLSKIRNHCKKQKSMGDPVRVLGFDYLQLVSSGNQPRRDLELGVMTRGLKLASKEFGLTAILLSQLSRESEKNNRRPQLSDFKDSGCIEADADIAILVHQLVDSDDSIKDVRDAELILAKSRNGPVSVIPTRFHKKWTYFCDPDFDVQIPA